jgi:hypothetical protein
MTGPIHEACCSHLVVSEIDACQPRNEAADSEIRTFADIYFSICSGA